MMAQTAWLVAATVDPDRHLEAAKEATGKDKPSDEEIAAAVYVISLPR